MTQKLKIRETINRKIYSNYIWDLSNNNNKYFCCSNILWILKTLHFVDIKEENNEIAANY